MRTLLNIIWLVLSGFWMFLGYLAAGVLLCIFIITIPWGIASFRIGMYALWPFGRTIVSKPRAGLGSFLGNVIWVIFAGWWLALGNILTGIAMCLTIIGIPLGLASFKLVPVSLMPLSRCMSAPAQNPLPAPVTTIAFTSGSAAPAASAPGPASRAAPRRAALGRWRRSLRAPGRSSCAATSAASESTGRCWPAAMTAGCRRWRPPSRAAA